MPTRMDEVLAARPSVEVINAALDTWPDREAADEIREIVRPTAVITHVNWGAMPDRAAAVADSLEAIAFDPESPASAHSCLDTATMIRVRAGGVARRGAPFDWKRTGSDSWAATSPTGTAWNVFGPELFVANWDHPDWLCHSAEQAKRVAEEIDARPKFPKRLQINETPVIEYEEERPAVKRGEISPRARSGWTPGGPSDPAVCDHCGSTMRAEWHKPPRQSVDWWIDPAAYWRCPDCHRGRARPADAPDPDELDRVYRRLLLPQPFPPRSEDL